MGSGEIPPLSPEPSVPEVFPLWTRYGLLLCLGHNFYGHTGKQDWSLVQLSVRPGCNHHGHTGSEGRTSVYMAVEPSLNYFRHTAMCWCLLGLPTKCGKARITLEGCQPG